MRSTFNWSSTNHIFLQDPNLLGENSYLWVFGWDNIPHLGFSSNGLYYSVSLKGLQLGTSTDVVFNAVRLKNLPTFLIQISQSFPQEKLELVFQNANLEEETCLNPILKLFGIQNEKCQTLHDLIDFLLTEDKIEQVLSFQKIEKIELLPYDKSDVLKYIQIEKEKYAVGK